MNITGSYGIRAFEGENTTIVSADRGTQILRSEPQITSESLSPYREMYNLVEPGDQPGKVVVKKAAYIFNSIGGESDPIPQSVTIWFSEISATVPEGANNGLIVFEYQITPVTNVEIGYYPMRPAATNHVYTRPLAWVSRPTGSDSVTIRQRHFGYVAIPSEQVAIGPNGGLFV